MNASEIESMSTMPAPIAEVHSGLKTVVITAHVRWTLAVQLFGSLDRVKLLYGVADVLFNEVKQMMISDVVLKLSQFDRQGSDGQEREPEVFSGCLRSWKRPNPA